MSLAATEASERGPHDRSNAARISRRSFLGATLAAPFLARAARAATSLNAYSIWPENYARPMMDAFEKASGIHVNFIRFSSGEALARVIAEKSNPQIDVLFGGPVETFTAGQGKDVFEPYKPASWSELPARFKDAGGMWTAMADDPLVFMANTEFLKQHNLNPPSSWDDLLNPAYKGMIQMADARTSGTAVTRIFSILQIHNRNEEQAFAYMKKLRQNVQLYTKSGGGGTLPVGLGQAGAGIFFIVDALYTRQQGYNVQISFPKEGIGSAAECIALIKGAKNPDAGKKLIDWATSPAMQSLLAPSKINFIPAHPKVETDPSLVSVLKGVKIIEIDDSWAGANRQRIVERWIAEVLNAS
ncbi:MAG: ABC transporter substrate-binding protein [Proteobacteria bacterium]|nr:ABC transporter substrate-binding protein [Pseudomonadota bacterium]MBI3496479.1 ABC transporter substrate-binding protein [Pseudomonadota bacterium]